MFILIRRSRVPVAGGGGGRGRGRGGAAMLNGAFTARLLLNGKRDTQTFNVKPDPRPRVS
jgi:hypothetical protein